MKIATRLDNFSEYIFARLAKKVTEIEQKTGRKVMNFGMGSPDFPPSKVYINKLKEYVAEPDSHLYPGFNALPVLAKALQNWHKKRFKVEIELDELYPLLGGKDAVAHLPMAILNADDEVLIPDPGYAAYTGPVLMIGAKPVYYSLLEQNDYRIDFRELEKKVTAKTKCIWINFPSNPTGKIATLKELEQIYDFCRLHNLWLLYDNAYSEITFTNFKAPSILQIKGAKEISIEINSFSKSYSFAGYRMGWIAGNPKLISALAKVKSQIDSGLSKPLQKLGAYALNHPDKEWQTAMINSYQYRRDIIINNLNKIGLKAQKSPGSLYLWVKIPDADENSEDFSMRLLEEKQILLTPGTAFGKNGKKYVRVSFCVNIDQISEYF